MLFSALPLELQNQVLINLDGISLAKAECVCEIWRELLSRVMYNLVWRRECLSTITESVLVEITGIENIMVCEPNSGIIRHDGSTTAASTHVWKIIYKRWYTSRKVGQWPVLEREIQTQKGAVCDIKLLGEVIYTADLDGSITLWDSWTGVCLQSFEGHLSSVRSIALYPSPANQLLTNEPCLPQLIISASEDRNICIWDVGTGVCKAILCGHNNIVSCVAIYKDLIVSASFDETIKLWDLKKDPHSACVNTLKGHYSPVTYLSVWKTKALSVSYNAIKFWSLETGECLYTVTNTDDVHTSTTEGCVLRGCHALFVKSDGQLKFCDFGRLSSGIKDEVSCVYRLLDYSTTQGSRVSCFSTFGNLMAVGSDAGVVYIFHYRNDWSEKVCLRSAKRLYLSGYRLSLFEPPSIMLSKLHCKVRTGHCGLCCVNLSNDGEGPVLAAGFHDGVVKIFRWFSPTLD